MDPNSLLIYNNNELPFSSKTSFWNVLISELLSRYTSSGVQLEGFGLSVILVAALAINLNNEATNFLLWTLWPTTNPQQAGRKLSMLVKASQWWETSQWTHGGSSWPFLVPNFWVPYIYGPGSWGLYQRKLECDTIVIFIQRARLVSRNHAWYTRCHTNKTEITSFDFIFRALKLHLIMIVHLSRAGAHHLLWLCNGQISNYCPAPRRSPCLWNSISSLELAQGCTNVILNRD